MNSPDSSARLAKARGVRLMVTLVTVTSILSLLYGIQYYAGGPLRLPVVSELNAVDLAPGARELAAGANDGRVLIWDVSSAIPTSVDRNFVAAEEEPWPSQTLGGQGDPVLDVGYTPDGGELLAVDQTATVRVWELSDGSVVQQLDLQSGPLVDADFDSSRHNVAVLSAYGDLQVWNIPAERMVLSVTDYEEGGRNTTRLSADGRLVAVGEGTGIVIWDIESGEIVQRLDGYCEDQVSNTPEACDEAGEDWLGHNEEVTVVAFSPDNQLIASGSADTTIVFWDLENGEARWSSVGHWATVTAMTFSDDGENLLSGGADYKSRNFRVAGGKSTAIFEGHLSDINDVLYGPTQDTIVTVGDDGTMRVWETANQYVVHLEWSKSGLQPTWGKLLAAWMLGSGILGLVVVSGLTRAKGWSHLLLLAMYILGPIVVLGLPILEEVQVSWLAGAALGLAILWAGLRRRQDLGWVSAIIIVAGVAALLWRPVRDAALLPRSTVLTASIVWPLLLMAAWYAYLLAVATREKTASIYEAPASAPLSEQLMITLRTRRTRLSIFGMAVWIALLVIVYSILRRFNLDVAFMGSFVRFIMLGSGITFYVSALSIVLAVGLALVGALGRLSSNPIANSASGFYISLIRGTPLLVQIYIWYLGLPRLDIVLEPRVAGVLALGVNYGAYMTEIFRAGIQAVSIGQREAAQALGMSSFQTFRRIVLPQAFRIVIPPIGNEFIAMMKDSSLVSVMAVQELTWRASKLGRQYFRGMETFIIAAAFYWILTVIFQLFQGKLEEYMARGERR